MPRLLVVGGSDAGITAARRARDLAPAWEITVVLADAFPNYSVCGLPFLLSGEVADAERLAHSRDFDGLDLRPDTRVTGFDLAARSLQACDRHGREVPLAWDRLVIATGARPVVPELPGANLPTVHLLRSMNDGLRLLAALDGAHRVVIVGGGYIGLEEADAMTRRRLEVTVISRSPQVLPTLDPELGALVGDELRAHGVRVCDGRSVEALEPAAPLGVVDGSGERHAADLVLLSVRVKPNSELAAAAGCALGAGGAVAVNARMRTGRDEVFAAGDCATTRHRLCPRDIYLPLGSTSHKQGRIAGENAIGGDRAFPGIVGTQVVEVFDLAAARTGLSEAEARRAGFDPLTRDAEPLDRNAYYPGSSRLRIRLTGDRRTGQLLGAQIVGRADAEVAKRVDIFGTAIFCGLKVEDLIDLDLSYSPPFASPWDVGQQAAFAWAGGS